MIIKQLSSFRMFLLIAMVGVGILSCQKLYRPPLNIIPDPPPPPYNPLKTFWSFDNNLTDAGEDSLAATAVNVSYTTGINGQALQGSQNGYVLVSAPGDTIKSLGSFTMAFWMNFTGPVTGGARGLFSISNNKQFWGNFDIFLENFGDDATTAFVKMHMYNSKYDADDSKSEEWTEMKLPNVYGKWSHIAITYDSATSVLTVFTDGASAFTKTIKGGDYGPIGFSNVSGMVLGTFQFQTSPSQTTSADAQGWAKNYEGALDQFRIYNKVLTNDEISQLFNSKE